MNARRRTVLALLAGCAVALAGPALAAGSAETAASAHALKLVRAARAQIGVTTRYDGAYRRIRYPMGDVPAQAGVCTDVVVRAWRAQGVDLQQLVHEDMRRAWPAYPKLWGLKRPDTNIDHRRVPNLAVFSGGGASRCPPAASLGTTGPATW